MSRHLGPWRMASPLWRVLAWAAGLSALLWLSRDLWSAHVLPLMKAMLSALDDTYQTLDLRVDRVAGEPAFVWSVRQVHSVVIDDAVAMPRPWWGAQASTLLSNFWAPPCLMWAWVLGHTPLRAWRHPAHGLALISLTAMLLALDVPLVLWAGVWSLHAEAMAPQHWSALLAWSRLMEGGGRWALAWGLGMALVTGVQRPLPEAPARTSLP